MLHKREKSRNEFLHPLISYAMCNMGFSYSYPGRVIRSLKKLLDYKEWYLRVLRSKKSKSVRDLCLCFALFSLIYNLTLFHLLWSGRGCRVEGQWKLLNLYWACSFNAATASILRPPRLSAVFTGACTFPLNDISVSAFPRGTPLLPSLTLVW